MGLIATTHSSNSVSHYYTRTGEPRYGATLRECRRELLLPSVTEILSVIAKPGLERWRREQVVEAAMTLPRNQLEDAESFKERVLSSAETKTRAAAQFGTEIHAACEKINLGGPVTRDEKLAPYIKHYWDWVVMRIGCVISAEQIFVNAESGYAGRCDLHAKLFIDGPYMEAIIDIKTQSLGKNKKPTFYDSWGMQLAAYAKCKGVSIGISVVINSDRPEPVYTKVWDNLDSYYEMFMHCHALWCFDKQYFPNQQAAIVRTAQENYEAGYDQGQSDAQSKV